MAWTTVVEYASIASPRRQESHELMSFAITPHEFQCEYFDVHKIWRQEAPTLCTYASACLNMVP